MRLRQAHAILEAATALEAAGLGFELFPQQYDFPGTLVTRDGMSGFAEISDPDDPEGANCRAYNIDLQPGPDDDTIEANLTLGIGPDPQSLLYSKYSVAFPEEDNERFRGLVGAQLAERICEKVHKNEGPHRAAYEARARRTP
ncbi:hypothetical protein [Streptomyces sp. SID4982]|uniref:hypothetical protein n=1 Tax=Streptomyces sp. SID4982 TaxID=2690291 RepID=UPI00136CF35D|nr:hypothetical protein [Streptomyces sp. SID4982]MYS16132.1 hypothetical protein [Streptomyces sp. SID4982]